MNDLPSVRIVEVGPRDGLQSEPTRLPTSLKIELIERLAAAGLRHIEATSFVSPKAVPQMADHAEVMGGLKNGDWRAGRVLSALVPNERGLESALAAGVDAVAVFGAASESFSQKNIHCSIDESLRRFAPVVARARQLGVPVRGYVSCVWGCPYEGEVATASVVRLASALSEMGCEEISLGDTLGTGRPRAVREMIEAVSRRVPLSALAGHFHDTYGMAIANVLAAWEAGLSVFDASVAGLGGCPYAPGARGNVATEEVVWLMQGMGVETGIDLEPLVDTACWIAEQLGRPPASRLSQAWRARQGLS